MDLTQPLLDTIKLVGLGFEFEQQITYLNKSNPCFYYYHEGHLIQDYPVHKQHSQQAPPNNSNHASANPIEGNLKSNTVTPPIHK